jgi:small subunit ribosomal protein S8e
VKVVYCSNTEFVRTNTLVKNAIVQIDGAPFKAWFEQHYGIEIGKAVKSRKHAAEEKPEEKKEEKKPEEKKEEKKPEEKKSEEKKPEKKPEEKKDDKKKDKKHKAAHGIRPDPKKDGKKRSDHVMTRLIKRLKHHAGLDPILVESFLSGRVFACLTSRPGQCGRADGYLLEGKELEFYVKKMKKKGHKET